MDLLDRLAPNEAAVSTGGLNGGPNASATSSSGLTFQPPSAPSSCVGSSVSSITPSSSISARMERSRKRKADDDAVSETLGSVVNAASGSRKRHAAGRLSQDINDLRDAITALQSILQTNIHLMERVIQSTSSMSTASRQTSQLVGPLGPEAEKRNRARIILLERDKDFLTPHQLAVMFDVLYNSKDNVDAYLLLATSSASTDEVRHSWLKRKVVSR